MRPDKVENDFKPGRMTVVASTRAKEALRLVEQDIETFKEEERSQLKQALKELEQSLSQIRAKL